MVVRACRDRDGEGGADGLEPPWGRMDGLPLAGPGSSADGQGIKSAHWGDSQLDLGLSQADSPPGIEKDALDK